VITKGEQVNLTSYLQGLFNFINPDLVKGGLQSLRPDGVEVNDVSEGTEQVGGVSASGVAGECGVGEPQTNCGVGSSRFSSSGEEKRVESCSNCTQYNSLSGTSSATNFDSKPVRVACASSTGCSINTGIYQSLNAVANNVDPDTWQVSEAWPPTVYHKNDCHFNGTCVDVKILSSTSESIANFASGSENAGLFVQYEVQTQARKDALIADGLPADLIIVESSINGEHFSVYRNSSKN